MIAQRYDQLQELHSVNAHSMSSLYSAFDIQKKQKVVLKMLKKDPTNARHNQKLHEMFEREITIALSLQHDHILRVIDHGTTSVTEVNAALGLKENRLRFAIHRPQIHDQEQVSFLVYHYMQDGSLYDLIYRLPPWQEWSLMQTADIILQAASALHYMHTLSQPLVHWDVKPSNFLVHREEKSSRIAHIFLCDFGISRVQKHHEDETSQPWGTPPYMAPEQFSRKVRCESDQYTLALMACYLLTGEYPLQAAHTDEWYYVHMNVIPRRPSAINPQRVQSPAIDNVILRALKKNPEERFPTIWLFAKALNVAIKQQDTAAHAPTIYVAESISPIEVQEPKFSPVPLHPPIDTDEYRLPIEPLPSIVQQAAPVKRQWGDLPYASSKILREYELPARPHTLCWSSDGNKLGCLFLAHPPLILHNDGTRQAINVIQESSLACWAPYSDHLAFSYQDITVEVGHSTISIIDLRSSLSQPLLISLPKSSTIYGLDWSVGERLAVWAEGEHQIWIYSLSRKALSARSIPSPQQLPSRMLPGSAGALCWSPNGALLAAGGKDGTVMCWREEKYELHWHNTDASQQIYALAWSPDSTHLAVAFKRRIVVWNVYQNRIQAEWQNLPFVPLMLSFSHDNQLSVASTKDYLLQGDINQQGHMVKQRGSLFASWSPIRPELVTLDPERDTKLVIWQK